MKNCAFRPRLGVFALFLFASPVVSLWAQAPSDRLNSTTPPVLAEVLVTATRFEESADTLPYGVSVVTAQDIAASGVATVNEAVMKLLGVPGRVDFYGGGDYSLDLRGFGSTAANNLAVVVDGIKVSELDLGGTRLAGIAIDSVQKIEVLRGSGAVVYGAGATGGVIVITTKAGRGAERTNSANVYAGAGSFGLRDVRGNATLARGGWSLDVSSSARQADNHRDNFRSEAQAHAATVQWSDERLRMGARYADDRLTAGLPGALSAAQFAQNPSQTNTPTQSAAIRNDMQSVFVQAFLPDWELGLDVGKRRKELDSQDNGVALYEYRIDASTANARAKNTLAWQSGYANSFTLGYDQANWRRTVLGAFGSDGQQNSKAVYARNELTLPTQTRVSLGWRTDRTQLNESSSLTDTAVVQKAWELGLMQPLGGGLNAYVRWGDSFRLANVDEVVFTQPGVLLKPQTSRDTELGLRWTGAQHRAEARWYRSALTDELGFDPSVPNAFAFGGFGANVNLDPTVRQGLEFEGLWSLHSALALRANAALRQAKFSAGVHSGKNIPLAPQRTLSVLADWRPLAAHAVNAGVVWVSKQSVDVDNQCSIPSYATLDARYAYTRGRVTLSAALANAANRKYYTQAFTCSAGATGGIYPEAGRALNVGMRVQF